MPRLRTIAASLLVITALFSTAACGGSDDGSDAKASAIDGILTMVDGGLGEVADECLKSNLEQLSTDQVAELRDAFVEAGGADFGGADFGNIPTELLPSDLADKATAIAQECLGTEAPVDMVTVATE